MQSENTTFKRSLGLLDGTMLVAGSMIGSGIFIVSADIARTVGSAGNLLLVWLISGLMTIIGAVSYGELSAMFPQAGGQYVYLRESYNRLIAFLYGWSFFAVIQTGTIAAVGVAFAKFTAYLFPALGDQNILFAAGSFHISAAQLVSIVLIVMLTYLNSRGVKGGKIVQTTFTLAKLLSLAALVIFGLLLGAKAGVWDANWEHAWIGGTRDATGATVLASTTGVALLSALAVSMVGALFSSDAWNSVTFIAGEIENPKRNVGLSLFLGTAIVSALYVLTNLMYLAVLPMSAIASAESDRVAVAASHVIFGGTGTLVIAVMVMVSTFGCVNGLVLSGARVYYTMAQDGVFFRKAGNLNANRVPGYGLWIQCLWASALCLTGKYGDLLDYVVFVVLIFYILTIGGIFILRAKQPNVDRPYKAFGYPILPALYIVLAVAICVALLIWKPTFTWPGLIIVLLGIPIFYGMRAINSQA
ncbi:amino acid permease [Pseudolysobacter antarcticus]|uniref:Amino acid permease n=1 Tax=Pseudolysobacter antarcticus TaxID=2511995 RepID=A0A411HFD8_9GAMM|nr:amino acid permease [Pseudolysobacter antarcticus]QBB69164.1 amino acid permease [Pseudolysobacter antarcticus]